MSPHEAKLLVELGYDRIADQYLASKDRSDPDTLAALAELTCDFPPEAQVLDLGCGAGIPATAWLAERFATTGVDISARQLRLARRYAPVATLVKSDMGAVDFRPDTFEAVVALYAIIHLPREEQPALVARIHRWLKPGGRFLATWAPNSWEGQESDWESWGTAMWWSHYDAHGSLKMLREAGFAVASARVHTDNGETWLWVMAHKPIQAEG